MSLRIGPFLLRLALVSACAPSLTACPSAAPEGDPEGAGGDATSTGTNATTSTGTPTSSGSGGTSTSSASSASGQGGDGGAPSSTSSGSGGDGGDDPTGTGGDPSSSGSGGEGGDTSAGGGGEGGGTPCEGVDLTNDEENCGECGHSCLGGACEDSECQVVVVGEALVPGTIALGTDRIWWIDEGLGTAYVTNGPKVPSLADPPASFEIDGDFTFALALTDDHVVWADFVADTAEKRTLDGEPPHTNLSDDITFDACRAMAGDGGEVFVACENNAAVVRVDVATGAAEELEADIAPSAVALDDTHVYFVDFPQTGPAPTGNVSRRRRDGTGGVEVLASGLNGVFDVAVHAGRVYFTHPQGIFWVEADGGEEQTPTQIVSGGSTYLAVDASGVYWFATASNRLRAADHDGADVRTLSEPAQVRDIVLDDGAVYWSDAAVQEIRKLAK